jgi:hypothetical protein
MGAASFGRYCTDIKLTQFYGAKCEGRPVRSKALALGASPEGVRGFKSHPSHL